MFSEILKSIVLGIIQGITEFLPISSSGHLTLAQHFLGIYEDTIQFDIVVHFATLLSVFTVMRKVLIRLFFLVVEDIKRMNFSGDGIMLLCKIIVATIPVGLIGVFFRDNIETLFHNIYVVAIAFCFTGLLLLSTKFLKTPSASGDIEDIKNISFLQSFVVGVFQMIAIVPGVSRSGTSIVGGMMTKLNNVTSVYFSFIISIPAILGATVLEVKNMAMSLSEINVWFLASGFLSAYISGVVGLTLVVKIAKNKKLFYFTPYLVILGVMLLVFA